MAFSLPFFKKKPEKHVYFGFYYTESRITGFAFDLDGGTANILSQNGYDVTAGYDKMLEDTDNLISDLESKTKLPLDKTIFFLHSILLDEQTRDIREPHKETLKKISKELELEPMGYIDLHEAIEGNMKENSVINNILLELSTHKLALFVYKGGIMTASQTISRTDSIAADLESALKMLPGKIILPTKIILYGVGDLGKASADLTQYKWDEKLFVQHPIIETIEDINLYQILADTFVEELLAPDHEAAPAQTPVVATETSAATETSLPFGFSTGTETPVSQKTVVTAAPQTPPTSIQTVTPVVEDIAEDTKPHWFAGIAQHFAVRPTISSNNKFMTIGLTVAGIVLLIGSLFMGYEYFLHTVTVEVKLPSEELSKDFDLTVPVVDAAESSGLSVVKHSKVIEYDEEKSTTGKRDVGEKAKGDVIVHNFDNSEKTIDRGTEIKTSNLIFTLDSDVKVASSSGISSDGVKQSGKQKVSATAKEIGPDYNISKGTQLKIGSLSDSLFIAIADVAFSGGTKKQVTTVSKSDLDSLKKTVEEEIKKQAKAEVEKLVEAKDDMIPELTSIDVTDTEYSGEVGEEAKNISIKASSEINYYTVDKKNIQKKLAELFSKEKKATYSIAENDIIYKVEKAEISEKGDEVDLAVKSSTLQFKEADGEKIKETITFKPVSSVESQIKKVSDIQSIDIISTAKGIPFSPGWLPLFSKNITVKTVQ